MYFSAYDGSTQVQHEELWKSDGTAAGTLKVKEDWPAEHLYLFTDVEGILYFSAYEDTHGQEIWKSDGTAPGTVILKDINDDYERVGSFPYGLTSVEGTLYFGADDGSDGMWLWKSDGTEAGTVKVKDIRPGFSPTLQPFLYSHTGVGETLYFDARDGIHGRELWASDGTALGTVMVKDLRPGPFGSSPFWLTDVGGTLYFAPRDGIHGAELWKSDGSTDGTVMVKEIRLGRGSSAPGELVYVAG